MRCCIHVVLLAILLLYANEAPCNCAPYYTIINKAEKEIVKGNYAGALALYDAAFKMNGYAADYFNAGFCALFMHEQKLSLNYFSKYLQKGASYSYLAAELAKYFPAIGRAYIDDLEKYKLSTRLSCVEVNMLDSLLKVDQHYHDLRLHGLDSIQVYDRLNYQCLAAYIEKNGFPAERQCVLDPGNTVLPGCYILFRHFIQAGIFGKGDLDILVAAVCDGKLSPEVLSDDMNLYYQKDLFGNDIIMKVVVSDDLEKTDSAAHNFYVRNDLWVLKPGIVNENEIGRNRSEYHMEPLGDFLDKIKFVLTTDKPFILHTPYIRRSFINNVEDAKLELASYEPLRH